MPVVGALDVGIHLVVVGVFKSRRHVPVGPLPLNKPVGEFGGIRPGEGRCNLVPVAGLFVVHRD